MDDYEAIGCIKRGDISGLELLITRHQLKAIGIHSCEKADFRHHQNDPTGLKLYLYL